MRAYWSCGTCYWHSSTPDIRKEHLLGKFILHLVIVLVVDLAQFQFTHQQRKAFRWLVPCRQVHGGLTFVVFLFGVRILCDEQAKAAKVPLKHTKCLSELRLWSKTITHPIVVFFLFVLVHRKKLHLLWRLGRVGGGRPRRQRPWR